MAEILFLEPALHEKIWGGDRIAKRFGFKIPTNHTGEAWLISGHNNGITTIKNGMYSGRSLKQLWQDNQLEIFGSTASDKPFPLLVKILDAQKNLSVQVHPGDEYALQHANDLGKTECWYILEADPESKLYLGHNAKTREEFNKMLDNRDWSHLLKTVPIKKGNFIFVPSGTLHALGAGVLALEIQQSSDVTYRVYDFDRVNEKTGKQRELHIDDAKKVTLVPDTNITVQDTSVDDKSCQTLVTSKYFNVNKWMVKDSLTLNKTSNYELCSVINGSGSIITTDHEYTLKKGDAFVIPNSVEKWCLKGPLEILSATPGDSNTFEKRIFNM